MNDLVIKITGAVEESNFLEFKDQFIEQIKAADKELKTDQDFADAESLIKTFEAGEKAIEQAKKAAMDKTADISSLFAALDELSGELRTTRLSLNKQVTAEKERRKNDIISEGIDQARTILDSFIESESLPELKHWFSVDRSRFVEAVKGKRKLETMEESVGLVCKDITEELKGLARQAATNAGIIEKLDKEYQCMFLDRQYLLKMSEIELDATIKSRISKYKEDKAKQELEEANRAKQAEQEQRQKQEESKAVVPEKKPEPAQQITEKNAEVLEDIHGYVMQVIIRSSKERAVEIAQAVNAVIDDIPEVEAVKLRTIDTDNQ